MAGGWGLGVGGGSRGNLVIVDQNGFWKWYNCVCELVYTIKLADVNNHPLLFCVIAVILYQLELCYKVKQSALLQ